VHRVQEQLTQGPGFQLTHGARTSVTKYVRQPRQDRCLLLRNLKGTVLDPAVTSASFSASTCSMAEGRSPAQSDGSDGAAHSPGLAEHASAEQEAAATFSKRPVQSSDRPFAAAHERAATGSEGNGTSSAAHARILPDQAQSTSAAGAHSRTRPFHASLNNRGLSAMATHLQPGSTEMGAAAALSRTGNNQLSANHKQPDSGASEEDGTVHIDAVLAQRAARGSAPNLERSQTASTRPSPSQHASAARTEQTATVQSTVQTSRTEPALANGVNVRMWSDAQSSPEQHPGPPVQTKRSDAAHGADSRASSWGWPVAGTASSAADHVMSASHSFPDVHIEGWVAPALPEAFATIDLADHPSSNADLQQTSPSAAPASAEQRLLPSHKASVPNGEGARADGPDRALAEAYRDAVTGHLEPGAVAGHATCASPADVQREALCGHAALQPVRPELHPAGASSQAYSIEFAATSQASSATAAAAQAVKDTAPRKQPASWPLSESGQDALREACVPFADGEPWHCHELFQEEGGHARDRLFMTRPVVARSPPLGLAGALRCCAACESSFVHYLACLQGALHCQSMHAEAHS
jgi:hypothetical protein